MSPLPTSVVARHPVTAFVATTFALSWLSWLGGVRVGLSPIGAVLVGAWGPTVAALLVTWHLDGLPGVRRLLARFGRWRLPLVSYGFAVGLPCALAGVAVVGARAAGVPAELTVDLWLLPVVFLASVLLGGPVAEELGWRGFATPRLRARYGVVGSGVLVGIAWAVWHLPLYYLLPGGLFVGAYPLPWFVGLVVAYSVLFSWLVTVSRDSVLPAVLFHAAVNTVAALGWVGTATLPLYLLVVVLAGLLLVTTGRRSSVEPERTSDPQ